VKTHPHYAIQAVIVYIAVGVALGMVGWALLIHDGGGGQTTTRTPAGHAPAQTDARR
jgi:hypothetical protein